MRMTLILASICSLLISCATLSGESTPNGEPSSLDSAATPAAAPSLDANVAPAPSADQTNASQDMGDGGQAGMDVQAAEHQTVQADVNNEQRSTSELDAAAPETSSVGTDGFYASTQQTPPTPEVEQVTTGAMPTELPQKQVASWDQHTESIPSYQEEKALPAKKSKKIAKHKHDKKKVAKHSKKSKKELVAKHSKKSKRNIASIKKSSKKPSKVDCKKVAKHAKKASKHEVAMCKAEKKKKMASKSHKNRKVAQAACQCDYR